MSRDPRVTKIIDATKKFDAGVDDWINEIMSLHSVRGIRALNTTALLQSSVFIAMEANLENQATRSRCVEIQAKAYKQQAILEEKLDLLTKYLMSKYSDELREEYKSITERKTAIATALKQLERIKRRLKNVDKIATMVIGDTDQAGFTLKRIGDLIEIKSRDK